MQHNLKLNGGAILLDSCIENPISPTREECFAEAIPICKAFFVSEISLLALTDISPMPIVKALSL